MSEGKAVIKAIRSLLGHDPEQAAAKAKSLLERDPQNFHACVQLSYKKLLLMHLSLGMFFSGLLLTN